MTERRGTLHAVCVLCGMSSVATPGLAQPAPAATVALAWQAPAGCPTQSEVRSALARAVDSGLEPELGPTLHVNVVVEQTDVRWQARLLMSGALEAERTLEGDACSSLAEASVWLVVQTLRSLAATRADETPASMPELESTPPLAVAPDGALASPHSEPRAAARDQPPVAAGARSLELALGVWWDSGALPDSTVALGFELGLGLRSWRFALRPRVFIPRSTAPQDFQLAGTSASFWLAELPMQVCYGLGLGELRIGPCASLIAGLMGGSSEGVPEARTAVGTWLALEGAMAAVWAITARVTLRAELALARPLRAPRFVVGANELHRADDVLVRAGLALGAHF